MRLLNYPRKFGGALAHPRTPLFTPLLFQGFIVFLNLRHLNRERETLGQVLQVALVVNSRDGEWGRGGYLLERGNSYVLLYETYICFLQPHTLVGNI